MVDTLIKNGIVVTAEGRFQADVAIQGEKIIAVAEPDTFNDAKHVIDAHGAYIMPGAIDTHTHIEEPFQNQTPEENWFDGTRNAAMGGVTTVMNFCIQQQNEPLMQNIRRDMARIPEMACVDYTFHGVFSNYSDLDSVLREIDESFAAGIPSLKAFMIYSTDGLYADDWSLYCIMRKLAQLGGWLGLHAENQGIGENLQQELIRNGQTSSHYWPQAKPNFVEAEAVNRACMLAKETGCRVYIAHTSTKEAVEIVKRYQSEGVQVFCESCAHYFTFDSTLYDKPDYGVWEIISPPLREKDNQGRLWEGINEGVVSIIGSDHNAYGKGPKEAGYAKQGFFGVSNGGPGIIENVGIFFSEGVVKNRITAERFAEITSTNPARMFGLYPRKGAIMPGSDADLVLWDPNTKRTFSKDLYISMDWTPYEGIQVQGAPVLTMVRGQIVMENDTFKGERGYGRFISGKLNKNDMSNIR